jgi:hypothetical protein
MFQTNNLQPKLAIAFFLSCLILPAIFVVRITESAADNRQNDLIGSRSPTPTPSPTAAPVVVDVSPIILPTDQPELNLTDFADYAYGGPDVDCDGIPNAEDNCVFTFNPNQKDSDKNRIGDACSGSNQGKPEIHCDTDGDGVKDYRDNCQLVCNPGQVDTNKNGIGDVCDPALVTDWVRMQFCEKSTKQKPCPSSKNNNPKSQVKLR